MVTGIAVPLEAAIGLWLAGLMLGIAAGRLRGREPRGPAAKRDPLAGLFSSGMMSSAVQHANRRTASGMGRRAVLRGRIDQMAMLQTGWDPQTRQQMLDQIAAIMQAGLRSDDDFAALDNDGFTITMDGADEAAAKRVAARLRHALLQLRLPQLGGANPFTASFGVASGEIQDNGVTLVARARAALDAAQQTGADQVVAASEMEDVIFLPPPDEGIAAA